MQQRLQAEQAGHVARLDRMLNPPEPVRDSRIEKTRPPGHPRFLELLATMRSTHLSKDADYSGNHKPFHNFYAGEPIGVKAWQSAYARLGDKSTRLQNLLEREHLEKTGPAVKDESIEDTLIDLASIALIVLVLREEAKNAGPK